MLFFSHVNWIFCCLYVAFYNYWASVMYPIIVSNGLCTKLTYKYFLWIINITKSVYWFFFSAWIFCTKIQRKFVQGWPRRVPVKIPWPWAKVLIFLFNENLIPHTIQTTSFLVFNFDNKTGEKRCNLRCEICPEISNMIFQMHLQIVPTFRQFWCQNWNPKGKRYELDLLRSSTFGAVHRECTR